MPSFTNWRTGTVYRGTRTKKDIMSGVTEKVVKSKFVANNTVEYITTDGRRIIRFHDTDILIFRPEGLVQLFNGGWKTRTTKDRLNTFGKVFTLWQDKKVWWVVDINRKKHVFYDGMALPMKRKPKWRI